MLSPASTNHDSLSSGGQRSFLRRITHDDEFRASLESDPQTALAEYGLQVDSQSLPTSVALPDKATLSALLDEIGKSSWPPDLPWAGWFASKSLGS